MQRQFGFTRAAPRVLAVKPGAESMLEPRALPVASPKRLFMMGFVLAALAIRLLLAPRRAV